jgi:hypothetical protein
MGVWLFTGTSRRAGNLPRDYAGQIFDTSAVDLPGPRWVGLQIEANSIADVKYALILNVVLMDEDGLVGCFGFGPIEASTAIADDDACHNASQEQNQK